MYSIVTSDLIPIDQLVLFLKQYFKTDNVYNACDLESYPAVAPDNIISYMYYEYDESESNFPLMIEVYTKDDVTQKLELDFAQSLAQKYCCNCIFDDRDSTYTWLMVNSHGSIIKMSEYNGRFTIYDDTDDT